MAVWNGKNAGRNDNLLHEEKARASVVFSLKRSLTVPSNLVRLFGNEIKFQAIEKVG